MSTQSFASSTRCGTVVPNRIFVGGISSTTTEAELNALFQQYGRIKATKIIVDRTGISKGYGFVTFDTEEEAQKVLNEVDGLVLKDRKLNIAPAVKKMNLAPLLGDAGQVPGSPVLSGREGIFQAAYPVVVQQPLYLPQYYHPTAAAASVGYHPQYVYTALNPSDLFNYSSVVSPQPHNVDYSESSDAASDGGKPYSKHSSVQTSSSSEYDNRSPKAKPHHASPTAFRYSSGSSIPSTPVNAQPCHLHPVLQPKAGMAIMAYPGSLVMGTPILHVKESAGSDSDGMLTDLGFLHSPMQSQLASGAMTPPPTPHASMTCDFGSSSGIETVRKN